MCDNMYVCIVDVTLENIRLGRVKPRRSIHTVDVLIVVMVCSFE